MSQPEISKGDGLRVIYDEEARSLSFEWDSETHPEYDYLLGLTSESLATLLTAHLESLDDGESPAEGTSLPTG